MPGGDRTGPLGFGPMSGKGMGWCGMRAGAPMGAGRGAMGAPGAGAGRGFGRGWGRSQQGAAFPGRGRGRGLCWTSAPAPAVQPPETELAYLANYALDLEASLNAVKSRMESLKGSQEMSPETVE